MYGSGKHIWFNRLLTQAGCSFICKNKGENNRYIVCEDGGNETCIGHTSYSLNNRSKFRMRHTISETLTTFQ